MATTKQTDNAPQAAPQTLAEALAAAQLEIADPQKDAVNPHFRSRYADLATVLKTVRPVLARHGLAITQTTQILDGALVLVTRLHWKDEELAGYYPISPTKADPQGYGSALTYARRYTIQAIVGVAADDDDDGNAASAAPSKPAHDELAEVIGKVKACNSLDDLKALKADCARLGAAAVAAYKARGQYLQAAAEAP